MAGDGGEAFGGGFFKIFAAMLEAEFDEVIFQPGSVEEFIDTDEELALFAVFFAAVDFR